jgi:hypothetical protein
MLVLLQLLGVRKEHSNPGLIETLGTIFEQA